MPTEDEFARVGSMPISMHKLEQVSHLVAPLQKSYFSKIIFVKRLTASSRRSVGLGLVFVNEDIFLSMDLRICLMPALAVINSSSISCCISFSGVIVVQFYCLDTLLSNQCRKCIVHHFLTSPRVSRAQGQDLYPHFLPFSLCNAFAVFYIFTTLNYCIYNIYNKNKHLRQCNPPVQPQCNRESLATKNTLAKVA